MAVAKRSYDAQKRHEYYMKHRKLKGKRKKKTADAYATATKKKKTKKKARVTTEMVAGSVQSGKRAGRTVSAAEMMELLAKQNEKLLGKVSSLKTKISKMSPEEKKKNKDKLKNEIKKLQASTKLSAKIGKKLSKA